MLEINTRVVVTLVPLAGAPRNKRVYGRLAAPYMGVGPVHVRSGDETTTVPAERILFVQTRKGESGGEKPDWLYDKPY